MAKEVELAAEPRVGAKVAAQVALGAQLQLPLATSSVRRASVGTETASLTNHLLPAVDQQQVLAR